MYPPRRQDKLFIGGAWVVPQTLNMIDVVSPWDEQIVASVAEASKEDVDLAVASARKAFDTGPWPRMLMNERIAIMRQVGIALDKNRELLAHTITMEMGSPITQSTNLQAVVPRTMLDAFIQLAESYPLEMLRRSSSGNGLVFREPKGVVAAIIPWNTPVMAAMMKLGPALLMGCCVILKPAPETPLSASILADILHKAGVPEGVVSVLPARREVSEYLALHPGIDKVSFTGSTSAGRHLASLCGTALRSITLELGGKSAALVLDDADISATIESLRMGAFRNSGQICSLKTRILVPRLREREILERLVQLVETMPVGDPFDPATQIGPMVNAKQRDRIQHYIALGISEGARLVHGGPGHPVGLPRGWFVRPTIFSSVDPAATIAQDEIFGPVVSVISYETEDQAIAIANNSAYGLNGAIFSADVPRAIELARCIKTGVVEINGCSVGFHSPIGGMKQSGIGREAGYEGFDAFTELKSVGISRPYADAFSETRHDFATQLHNLSKGY